MSSDLKPGDRALVVGLTGQDSVMFNGMVCVVLDISRQPTADSYGNFYYDEVCDVDILPSDECLPLANLIRIPPDSEMRQMFREAERPREAA